MIYPSVLQSIVFTLCTFASFLVLAADPNRAAMTLVKKTGLNNNLPSLSYQYAQRTTTYQIMVKSVGAEQARLLMQDEINQARPKYQEQWDKNLAASYVETFTPSELESLAANPETSPYVSKLMANQNSVGQRMRAKSTVLLKALLTEALTNAFSKITPKQ